MPFIETKTNVSLAADKEVRLKSAFADCIAAIPGKTERWLMVSFEPDVHMYFGGSDAPCAMIRVEAFGKINDGDCRKVTAAMTACVSEILGIPGDRVYIRYEECDKWGWNGSNF